MNSVQAKLKVSRPGDVYEREADRIAEEVMRMPGHARMSFPVSDQKEKRIDRKCAACEMEGAKEKFDH